VDAAQQQTISDPAFETAVRAKAKDIINTLDVTLDIEASPVAFTVTGIDVTLIWGENDATVTIAGGAYALRIPVAWLTAAAP
jgi:hypothetical protein